MFNNMHFIKSHIKDGMATQKFLYRADQILVPNHNKACYNIYVAD